jgi:hypothetical protein
LLIEVCSPARLNRLHACLVRDIYSHRQRTPPSVVKRYTVLVARKMDQNRRVKTTGGRFTPLVYDQVYSAWASCRQQAHATSVNHSKGWFALCSCCCEIIHHRGTHTEAVWTSFILPLIGFKATEAIRSLHKPGHLTQTLILFIII